MPKMAAMKILPLVISLLVHSISCEVPKYTDKYDNIDLEDIMSSERLLTGYIKCLMDQAPCTPDGKELKNNIPDAITNDCKKCTERQRIGSDKMMEYIIDHRPDDWVKLEQKYNSDGSYKAKYLKRKAAENAKTSAAASTNEVNTKAKEDEEKSNNEED